MDALDEHRAAIAKIDAAVAQSTTKAGDALTCHRGCDACCVDGLTVLPVEAALVRDALDRALVRAPAHPSSKPDRCAFLDVDGACSIYDVRPVLCRTHGLALQKSDVKPGALPIVSSCELNYTNRAPTPSEALDADRILALLVTVDRRYRARVGLDDDDEGRVALRDLANCEE